MEKLTEIIEHAPLLVMAFTFVLGTIVGSFLNVVVYRLPLGANLMHPPSHCPHCAHAIRWYDNVPILGWLWLRGRCRDCGAPISARYPLVEFLVGIIFLTFCWIDVIVPMQSALEAALAAMFAGQPEPDPHTEQCLALLLFHLLLLCPLLSAALIDADGHRLPRRLITWPAAAGILLAFGIPSVQAVSVNFANHSASDLASLWALAASLVGLIAAVGMRLGIISLLGPPRLNETGLANATLALYAVGAFLGWQAVWVVGLAAGAWALAAQSPTLKQVFQRLQPMAIVLAVTLFWCALDHSLAAWIYSR